MIGTAPHPRAQAYHRRMTTAAGSEQHTTADAERPTLGGAPGLTLLPGLDADAVGLCTDGYCRLPGAKE